jgi:unsaturated chondroitin disaccharide hydrolase
MSKMKTKLFTILVFIISFNASAQEKIDIKKQFELAAAQYELLLKAHPDTNKTPQSFKADGTYSDKPTEWWCSGFFGGSLWYLYEYTKENKWKDAAHLWTMAIQNEQYNKGTHDLGFMLYCPFGNGYRLTKNTAYPPIMLKGAESLSTRFDPEVGVIKSWDDFKGHKYPVIIDNMMNLEFLFWATKFGGNKKYYDLSIKHADATLKNHFRKDNSSYHVLLYEKGGKVSKKVTAQGAADESAWARGQAWALYGYVVMYRETQNKKYLKQAIKIADFIFNHPNMPTDKVPYWDFNAPNLPNEERDASAAAITSSALIELSTYVKKDKQKNYFDNAELMLVSLSLPAYRAKLNENGNFLLKHSVGHKPANSEIDVPLVYADYYYLEALLRYKALIDKQ